MTDPTKKSDAANPDPKPGAVVDLVEPEESPAPSERPTVVPPFDLAAYAQVAAAPSVEPPPELEWVEEDAEPEETLAASEEPTVRPGGLAEDGSNGAPGRGVSVPPLPPLPDEGPPEQPEPTVGAAVHEALAGPGRGGPAIRCREPCRRPADIDVVRRRATVGRVR